MWILDIYNNNSIRRSDDSNNVLEKRKDRVPMKDREREGESVREESES